MNRQSIELINSAADRQGHGPRLIGSNCERGLGDPGDAARRPRGRWEPERYGVGVAIGGGGRMVPEATMIDALPFAEVTLTVMLTGCAAVPAPGSASSSAKWNRVRPSTNWLNDSQSGTVMLPPTICPAFA